MIDLASMPDLVVDGLRVRSRRVELDLSQKRLARAARVSVETIEAIEQGLQQNPTLKILGRLAQALRLPLADLVTGADPSA
jgi:transcriptional regulator with XRE-family HTH domain